jgi:hypothetical protein
MSPCQYSSATTKFPRPKVTKRKACSNSHDSKAGPLHADLRDAQESSETRKLIHLATTCDVCPRAG